MSTKIGGSEARKPRSLKSGGLKPSSLIEVYAQLVHGWVTVFGRVNLHRGTEPGTQVDSA